MPTFVNDRDHAVRVIKPGPNGAEKLVRIRAGQVVEADGEYADNLEYAGLASASSEDQDRYEASLAASRQDVTPGVGSRLAARFALGPRFVALRAALVVAPLRRVVGDDLAPYGPPSGVITTKASVVGDGTDFEARRAFADNEAVPGQRVENAGEVDPLMPAAVVPTESEIFNSQVTNAENAEVAAQAFLGGDVADDAVGSSQTSAPNEYLGKTRAELVGLAEERGVSVTGTGSGGYATKADYANALIAGDSGGEPPQEGEVAEVALAEEPGEQAVGIEATPESPEPGPEEQPGTEPEV